jgi:hypothetical protein
VKAVLRRKGYPQNSQLLKKNHQKDQRREKPVRGLKH